MRFIATLFLGLALLCVGELQAQQAGSDRLGAEVVDLTKDEADTLGWEEPRGAKVIQLSSGSPAEAAGLLPDDVLILLDGVEIENAKSLIEALANKAAGAQVRLSVRRAGREKRIAVTLGVRPGGSAAAKLPEDGPHLMLDTGGHMALISGIAFTPDGRQLVSAAHDKTIRVWDLETGKILRSIRGEVAPGQAGKIYSIALSADGKWFAAAGWFSGTREESTAIRLYEFSSGRLVALLKGHGDAVTSVAFSPDGRHLISGSGDHTAIIWDIEAKRLVHQLRGHTAEVYGVAFTPDSLRAVTGSLDHDLRLWGIDDAREIARLQGHAKPIYSVAISRDGTIASGDISGEIRLWNGETGAARNVLARQGSVGNLSFSPDSRLLLSGVGGVPSDCHVYDVLSGRETATYRGHDYPVRATAISPDGRWAATGGGTNNEIHIWDPRTGKRRLRPDGNPWTLSGVGRPVWAVGFSVDGKQIAWGSTLRQTSPNDRGPLQHGLMLPTVAGAPLGPRVLDAEAVSRMRRAATMQDDWSLNVRKGGNFGFDAILDVRRSGRVIASIERGATDGFGHHNYSLVPDSDTIISGGGSGVLSAYDREGRKLGDFIGHEGEVWAVAPSPDGRLLVSGSADQTLRLWNLKTRELLVSLFHSPDGEWAMWTPQGYYAASGAGADLVGWQINHGPDHEAEYVTAAQIRKSLNRPDIVTRAIQLASAEAAVTEAYGTNFKLTDLLAKPVPRFRIVSPSVNAALSGGRTEVRVAVDGTPDPIKLIRIQVNGHQIAQHLPAQGGGFAPGRLNFTVPLSKGANTIRLTAVNETGETPADVAVTHEGDGNLDKRGTLYILAIGVDKYPNIPGHDLRFSGADAKAFAQVMEKRAGALHEKVIKRVLVNGASPGDAPTAANILNALGILQQTRDTDTVVVFVAGHGINEGPNYRFLPTDSARQAGGGLVPASVVPWYAFQEAIESAKGRRILFLDTCHSGNSYNQRLSNDSYQANIIVYSAARWDQFSWENAELGGGHGLFTYAAVEGLEGKAAKSEDGGRITTLALRDFLTARVTELAGKMKQQQEPQYFRGRDAENYLLARGR